MNDRVLLNDGCTKRIALIGYEEQLCSEKRNTRYV